MDSRVSAGIGVPCVATALAPAAARSHCSRAPAASIASTAALTTSGPIPSPGIRVTGIDMADSVAGSSQNFGFQRLLARLPSAPDREGEPGFLPDRYDQEDHLQEEQAEAQAVQQAEPAGGGGPGSPHAVDGRGD